MIKKYRKYIGWGLLIAYLVIVLAIVAQYEKRVPVRAYQVVFKDTLNHFITASDIDSLLTKEYDITNASLNKLEIAKLEEDIERIPAVRNAETFTKMDGLLMVEINTEKPIVRVINNRDESFYISATGQLMPYSNNAVPRVLVASGHIPFRYSGTLNLQERTQTFPVAIGIYRMARFIEANAFWKKQIQQLYVTPQREFELYPRVGAHVIMFGDTTDIQWKFRKLYALYEKGFRIKHWNDYEEINLKFDNQIVCKKR